MYLAQRLRNWVMGCRVELACRIRPLEREGSIPVDDRRRLGGLVDLGDDSWHIACWWAWP